MMFICSRNLSHLSQGVGRQAPVWRAACPHAPCEAELAACRAPGEESRGARGCGRECGSPSFRLGILAVARSLSRAFLRCGSPALEVLSTARFCGFTMATAEMPQGSDLAADGLGQRRKF